MKKYFLTGLIILLPFLLTLMIVLYLVDLFTGPFVNIVETWIINFEEVRGVILKHHDFLVGLISRTFIFICLLIFITFLGFLARRFFFDSLLGWVNKLLSKIPIVKFIYRISRDITKAVFTQETKTFKETAVIPFPWEDTYSIALVTGTVPDQIRKVIPNAELTVFVPTSPHPISGFLLLTPKKYVHKVDVTTEDAFKFLLSAGIIHPSTHLGTPVPPASPKLTGEEPPGAK